MLNLVIPKISCLRGCWCLKAKCEAGSKNIRGPDLPTCPTATSDPSSLVSSSAVGIRHLRALDFRVVMQDTDSVRLF